MRKTPAYLKGLAETRGRLAGDVQRYQQVLAEVTASLVKAQTELNACDTLISKFDERLDPGLVQPIHAWQGRYGKRGALGRPLSSCSRRGRRSRSPRPRSAGRCSSSSASRSATRRSGKHG